MINDPSVVADFVDIHPEDRHRDAQALPNEEHEFVYAKTFLQKCSSITGENLYDHLSDVLNKILAERPQNVVDFFEEYSRKIKERRFKPLTDHFEDIFVPPGSFKKSNELIGLLKPLPPEEPSTMDPEDLRKADINNNLSELLYYLEQAGIGLPRVEMFCMNMSIKRLIREEPIADVKFWGKIFGVPKNYIILETTLKDEEYAKKNEAYNIANNDIENPISEKEEEAIREDEILGEDTLPKLWENLPALPKSEHVETPEPPPEPSGVGVNKKVYYVCNEIGERWIQLPDVTPKQIRVARKIHNIFTGNLDQSVLTYPKFPGHERNYLRAQIARISASTHISPQGFYHFGSEVLGEDEEMDEELEDTDKSEIRENPKYEPLSLKDLTDKSMRYWVHHNLHILEQGRTTWWNPNPLPEGLDEELGEEEEEKPAVIGPEPESGPPLLTPCAEDVTLDAIPAWSVRSSSRIAEESAIAIVQSNFWPGAFCFANQSKIFHNVYFGNGLKLKVPNFSPMPLPPVEQEYTIGPEVLEMLDPSGAEEETWRIAHLPKEKPPGLTGEEEEQPEEEEEEEEEEDD